MQIMWNNNVIRNWMVDIVNLSMVNVWIGHVIMLLKHWPVQHSAVNLIRHVLLNLH